MLNCSTAAVVRDAKEVGAVRHLEVAVRLIVIADEGQTIGSDGHGAVLAEVTRWTLHRGEGGSGAGHVRAVGHLRSSLPSSL